MRRCLGIAAVGTRWFRFCPFEGRTRCVGHKRSTDIRYQSTVELVASIYCAGDRFGASLIPTVTIGMCRFVPLSVHKFIGVIGAVKCIYLSVVSNDLLKRALKLISDWLPCLFVHQTAAQIGSTENDNWKVPPLLECTNPIFCLCEGNCDFRTVLLL